MKPHNPDSLTPEQVGVADGYRLLDEDEIKKRRPDSRIQMANLLIGMWLTGGFSGDDSKKTYRTRLTREELAKLK